MLLCNRSQKVLRYGKSVFNELFIGEFARINYIRRDAIEQKISDALSSTFRSSKTFGVIVYGSKGIGKSTVTHKVLIDEFSGPVNWWQNMLNGVNYVARKMTRTPQGTTQACPCLTIWVDISLAQCKTRADILNEITNEMLGANTGRHLATIMHSIRDKLLPFDSNLLLYLHINSMPQEVGDNETHPFLLLEQVVRNLANKRRMGVLIEISKSWYPALNQGTYFVGG